MITKENIVQGLSTTIFGNFTYHFDEIDSTNSQAIKLAREGAPEGTVVVASYQTKGRGRHTNQWLADRDKNVLLSIILRPVDSGIRTTHNAGQC